MATLVAEVRDGRDHDRDPVQLRLPRTGHTIDLATFSRLRTTSGRRPAQRDGLAAPRSRAPEQTVREFEASRHATMR